jgi:NADH:ubiquinone oxidoreductase subunit C
MWSDEVVGALTSVLGSEPIADEGFGQLTVSIGTDDWLTAAQTLRDDVGCAFFDWLSAVDQLSDGFSVVCHVARRAVGSVEHVIISTNIPRDTPVVASIASVYAGAKWHERETHEMFGIDFEGAARLDTLLLPEGFEGHPLRKDFVLASRVAKPWPGAKEPGESDHQAAPSRRRMLPPGVPHQDSWGPRAPGSPTPDPLAAAQAPSTRPRRAAPDPSARPRRAAPDPSAPPRRAPRPAPEPAETDPADGAGDG